MKRCLFLIGVLLLATRAHAATITVCASGCTNTNTQLQTALDAANPGDTIQLQQNFVYQGDFILPNAKSCPAQDVTCMITVTTGVTSTGTAVPSTDFPLANVRIDPSYAPKLAKVQGNGNTAPAFRTTYPEEIRTGCAAAICISKWWTFKNLEIRSQNYGLGTTWGGFSLLTLGSNDGTGTPNNNFQDTVAKQPIQFTLDRVLMHGDPVMGQKYGVLISARFVTIANSYIYDIKCTIPDCAGIGVQNSSGDTVITNSYVSASTEDFISGGTDLMTSNGRTVTASDTTHVTLGTAPVDLANGDPISCFVGGSARISSVTTGTPFTVVTSTAHGLTAGDAIMFMGVSATGALGSPRGVYTVAGVTNSTTFTVTVDSSHPNPGNSTSQGAVGKLANVQTSNVTNIAGSVLTLSPALTAGCDTTGHILWNITGKNLTVTKNWMAKDTGWRNPITPTPQNVQVTTAVTGGTFAAGTYYYRVIATTTINSANLAVSLPSTETSVVVAGGTTNANTITWTPVANASYYHVYGRAAGGETFRMYLVATAASCVANSGAGPCSVTDTNATTSGNCANETANGCTKTLPSGSSVGTTWSVKNVFELKNWDTALIEGNVFEDTWHSGQNGEAILLTTQNSSGGNLANRMANITFRNNIVRHANGGFQITASATGPPVQFSQIAHDITISNVLLDDIGGSTWNMGSQNGEVAKMPDGMRLTGPDNLTMNHLTVIGTHQWSFSPADTYSASGGMTNLVIKNSMFRKGSYGYFKSGSSEGNASWTASTGCATCGTAVWTKNVNVAANCTIYPSPFTNYCPTEAAWEAEFVNFGAGDYHLKSTSAYHNAGDDATDIGANIDTITAFTNIALSGNNAGSAPPPQPSITTTSPLTAATTNTPYTTTLVATSGTAPYTWTLTAGSLPTGLTLAPTGVIAGTPTSASSTFTATVTDAAAQTANRSFDLAVVTTTSPEPRPDKYGPSHRIFLAQPVCPDGTVDQIKVGDQCWDLTYNIMTCATDTSPVVIWSSCTAGGAPVILSGFNATAPSIVASNGVLAFEINVGTGTAASLGVLTMPRPALTGWICDVNNVTASAAHRADNTRQKSSTTTTVTLENQTTSTGAAVNWTASDHLLVACRDY